MDISRNILARFKRITMSKWLTNFFISIEEYKETYLFLKALHTPVKQWNKHVI